MKQLLYEFIDLPKLEAYYTSELFVDKKIILQVHSSDELVVNEIHALLVREDRSIQIIPIIEPDVKTTLFFNLYNQVAEVTNTESFLEQGIYKAIIDSTKEGFWLLDEELNIISINQAFASMLGYAESELLGKKPYELLALVDAQQSFCEEQAQDVHTSVQRNYELTFITKENKEFHTIVNATTIYLPENRIRSFAFITDISQQKELEQRLIEQQNYINELNTDLTQRVQEEVQENRNKDRIMYQQARLATMGEMIGNIAHQWRQPLNIIALIIQEFYISGQLGTLSQEKLEKEYARGNSVLQYMSNTIDDFRTFFQHSGEGENFCINASINSVMSLVSKGLEHNNIDIDLNVEEDISVFGHKNEFTQVLINIINNARDAVSAHTENGAITIKAYTDKEQIFLEIQDNGGGIKDDDINQIFEPYFTTKHQTQGTGLGLYMSHQIIVNNMNGTIYAKNRGEGTCFYISLPKSEKQTESVAAVLST